MLKIDLHLHTIASGHAQSTILEYINRAKELKMKIIGFADHGPKYKKAFIDELYFRALYRIPKEVNGLRILKSVEANIINKRGESDISDDTIKKKLDYIIAGFHEETDYKNRSFDNNTEAVLNCIKSGRVNLISHPFVLKKFKMDIEKVTQAACNFKVILEINLHSLKDDQIEDFTIPNLKKMIRILKRNKKKLIVNSDSHNIWEMADDSPLVKIKKKISLTNDMIINNYPKELMRLLRIK